MNNQLQIQDHELTKIKADRLGLNYSDIAKKVKTNKTYVFLAMNGKYPELLVKINSYLDKQLIN